MAKFTVKRENTKFVECPSGSKYYFVAENPIEVKSEDVEYFRSRNKDFIETGDENSSTLDRKGSLAPSDSKVLDSDSMHLSASAPKKAKKVKKGYDLDNLEVDEIIENDMFKKQSEGPWTCPVCGKTGLQTKGGVRSHVGSGACIRAAKGE